MERLTKKDFNFTSDYVKSSLQSWSIAQAMKKLQDYENLEEQGKLLKLPCAVGDTVYEVQEIRKRIQPYTIISASIDKGETWFFEWELKDRQGFYGRIDGFPERYLGLKVFLTREEAEAALRELENKKS